MKSGAKRLKISIACSSCRSKKVKCDGIRPACGNCQKKPFLRERCTYHTASTPAPQSPDSPFHPSHNVSSENTSSVTHFTNPEHSTECGYNAQNQGCSVFSADVKAAIDARLGFPSSEKAHPIPMVDAPLFGVLILPSPFAGRSFNLADNVLPPRKQADHLMDIYWRHIQPIEPFLDQDRLTTSYQALFTGNLEEGVDERVLLSTINTVFALSTQLQEELPSKTREDAGLVYFNRAWALLRPESVVWGPGSVEIIQCLLLMARYLQCTNNAHQTWMAVGSALRIAQSLNLHILATSVSDSPSKEALRGQQLWQCCVFLDRQVSWLFGRTSLASVTSSPVLPDSRTVERPSTFEYFTKLSEAYEIANQTMLAQASNSSNNNFAEKLGLPSIHQNQDYFDIAIQLDVCLSNWEKTIPTSLKLDMQNRGTNEILHNQRVMLQLRNLHARMHLFRPMLARLCLLQFPGSQSPTTGPNLKDRISLQCATICIECAQEMVSLIDEQAGFSRPNSTIPIPWWHRIFYLHSASTILIAASLRLDLFTPSVARSWDRAMSALRAQEHLSPFVSQCVRTFTSSREKIMHINNPGLDGHNQPEGATSACFQDAFQDLGFDPENALFGKEDLSWLSSFDPTNFV